MRDEFIHALEQGHTVVTATNRLAHATIQHFDQKQLAQGKQAWRSADVLSWSAWVQRLWHETPRPHTLVSDAQLQQLMSRVISQHLRSRPNHNLDTPLWNFAATANSALQAWSLIHEWGISISSISSAGNEDPQHFAAWANALQQQLRKQAWISQAELAEDLLQTNVPIIQSIYLAGFDQWLPNQTALLKHLSTIGTDIHYLEPQLAHTTPARKRHTFADPKKEWQHIGAWARAQLEADPTRQIGIIHPNTQSIKPIAALALAEQLHPQGLMQFEEDEQHEPIYHFSLGEPLARTAIVRSALQCLGLFSIIRFEDFSSWLLSAFWASDIDIDTRAQIEMQLRSKLAFEFDLYRLIQVLDSEQGAQQWLKATLQRLFDLHEQTSKKHTPRDWAVFFAESLNLLGWPKHNLTSHEHQCLEAWQECLKQLGSLEMITSTVTLSEALTTLRRLCEQAIYQDQANPAAQVHIMGALEASELHFDAVWLAGFDDNNWPPKAILNPFVPASIQKQKNIPEALPEQYLEQAKTKFEQLQSLAPEVVISHAINVDDVAVSISGMATKTERSDPTHQPFNLQAAICAQRPALESFIDDVGLPLPASSDAVPGGTGLLKAQAQCPFKAYAEYRLGVKPQPQPEPGTNPRTHGNAVHRALEYLWREIKTRDRLAKLLTDDALSSLISSTLTPILKQLNYNSGMGEAFNQAQQARLENLLSNWLQLEAKRPAFTVLEQEKKTQYQLAGLHLSISIDRLDHLSQSTSNEGEPQYAVIDYKTGGNNKDLDWCDDRPNEPQVPLYALAVDAMLQQAGAALNGEVSGVAFGQINAKDVRFVGSVKIADAIPGLMPPEAMIGNSKFKKDFGNWEALLPTWQQRLENIATSFIRADAQVDPKKLRTSCAFCELSSFCRIKEVEAAHPEIDDEPAF